MSRAPHIAFENGQPVQTVEPVFPDDEPGPGKTLNTPGIDGDAFQVLLGGLLLVIGGGHQDGARVRAIALATLCGLYPSDGAAAKKYGVECSTVRRARIRMQKELANQNLCARQNKSENPVNSV